jgi:hypothetical protein
MFKNQFDFFKKIKNNFLNKIIKILNYFKLFRLTMTLISYQINFELDWKKAKERSYYSFEIFYYLLEYWNDIIVFN